MLARQWLNNASPAFAESVDDRTIAVLPVGAIEQHGPHLPVGVDTLINHGVVDRALARLAGDVPVVVLPTLPFGKSDEHAAFPGTLSLSGETLIRVVVELGDSVAAAGIRKLVLVNSHGGQSRVLGDAALDLRRRHAMLAVTVSWYRLGDPAGLFGAEEAAHGIHAGAIETSVMLALHPDLVAMDRAGDFESASVALARERPLLAPGGRVAFAWESQDLHPSGACGNAAAADAGRGAALLDQAAGDLADLFVQLDGLAVDQALRPG